MTPECHLFLRPWLLVPLLILGMSEREYCINFPFFVGSAGEAPVGRRPLAGSVTGITDAVAFRFNSAGTQVPSSGGERRERRGRVFTPYWRAWTAAAWRETVPAPAVVTLPPGLRTEDIFPNGASHSPGLRPGGEAAAWRRGVLPAAGLA
jgi:hypothetical protein